MIKHIVLWKVKELHEGKDKKFITKKMKDDLEGLVGQIDVIKSLNVGIDISGNDNNYDVCLVSEFNDMNDLKAYATDPRHLEVGKYIKEVAISRVATDFEI
ncbi:Dabb family protein [Clostridium sp. MSJ-8]|uniref:Dabb family protein n=1 Tax=Clostridium sp. MSJ-8 TaxID=2841510 RepID=UPI001C0F1950|nr:Dabb family protein [Clostridium sp. MSJ-8]MBU5488966.1 Dabb family protein [Clostridium sp. MSJ-8]